MVDDLTNEVKGGFDDRALAVSFANPRGWRIVENVLIDITGELKLEEQSATLDGEAIVGVLLDAYEESLPTTVTKHSHNLGLVRIIVRPYAPPPPPSEDDDQATGQGQPTQPPPDFETVNKQGLENLTNLVRPPASTSTSATPSTSTSANSKAKPKPAPRSRSGKPNEPLG